MTAPHEYSDLSDLFEEEDASLELGGEQFVSSVMQQVSVRDTKRRWILAMAGLTGGVLAGAQMPDLIANMSGLEISFSQVLDTTKNELSQSTRTTTPLWWAMATVIGMSVLAVVQMERA